MQLQLLMNLMVHFFAIAVGFGVYVGFHVVFDIRLDPVFAVGITSGILIAWHFFRQRSQTRVAEQDENVVDTF